METHKEVQNMSMLHFDWIQWKHTRKCRICQCDILTGFNGNTEGSAEYLNVTILTGFNGNTQGSVEYVNVTF